MDERTNVGRIERIASVAAGAALAGVGLSRKSKSGTALALFGGAVAVRGITGHCYVYEALGITTAKEETGQAISASIPHERGITVDERVIINRTPEELFAFWRKLENLPRFMNHLESVTVIDHTRSHWVAKAPAGTSVEWDAEIINEIPNELIGWRSLEGSEIPNAGSVHFDSVGEGSEVRVILRYDPPAGELGAAVAKLFGEEPSQQVREDLERLKKLFQ